MSIREIAKKKGWATQAFKPAGKCRGCHKDIFFFEWTEHVWISPKGMYYHDI